MGRWAWSSRPMVEECTVISAFDRKWNLSRSYVVVQTTTRNGEPWVQKISTASTPCHFGGQRWWFWCPRCGRRAAKLLCPLGRRHYECRVCHDANYESQRRSNKAIWKVIARNTGYHWKDIKRAMKRQERR